MTMTPAGSRLKRSSELHERACRVLAGGVSTAFRAFERPVPLFVQSASGAHVVDVDGNDFVDFMCGFGPIILGHGDERVLEGAIAAARTVQQTGGQSLVECELAELLCQHVPAFEVVRLGLSGSEAIHAAVRVSRAATERPLLVKFAGHYHGWLDGIYTATTHPPPACPETAGQLSSALEDVVVVEWNDSEALRDLFAELGHKIAAVIMEPIACNQGVIYPHDGYLEYVRALTEANGALLIFDEVITGFRLGLGGAQAVVDVVPDLAITAKAMANGFPVSAFGGRRDLMDLIATNKVMHAGTFNAGGMSVGAAVATIRALAENGGAVYEKLAVLGHRLMAGLSEAAREWDLPLVVNGPGPVFFTWFSEQPVTSYADHLLADDARYARFAELMHAAGTRVIPSGRWYLSAAHTESDVDRALECAARVFASMAG